MKRSVLIGMMMLVVGPAFAGTGEVGSVDVSKFDTSDYARSGSIGGKADQKDYELLSRISAKISEQNCRTSDGEKAVGVLVGRHGQINSLQVLDNKIIAITQSGSLNQTANEVYETPTELTIILSADKSKVVSVTYQDLNLKIVKVSGSLLNETKSKISLTYKKDSSFKITCK